MQKYRFKFYLNAVHSIELNGAMGQEHPHTWEIGIDALKSDDSFIMFTEVEEAVEQLLSTYQDKNMNKIPPFDTLNPTLENVSAYLKKILEQYLLDQQWFLTKLEVSETPTRSFIIETNYDAEKANVKVDGTWFQTVENEVEKFITQKTQAPHPDEEEEVQKANTYSPEEIIILLERERAKIKIYRMFFLGLVALGVIGISILLIGEILK